VSTKDQDRDRRLKGIQDKIRENQQARQVRTYDEAGQLKKDWSDR